MNTVQSPRRQECNLCRRTFSKPEHLTRHVRCHTNEKPFQCPTCCKSYSRRKNNAHAISDVLLRHKRTHRVHEEAQSDGLPLEPDPPTMNTSPSTAESDASSFQSVPTPWVGDPQGLLAATSSIPRTLSLSSIECDVEKGTVSLNELGAGSSLGILSEGFSSLQPETSFFQEDDINALDFSMTTTISYGVPTPDKTHPRDRNSLTGWGIVTPAECVVQNNEIMEGQKEEKDHDPFSPIFEWQESESGRRSPLANTGHWGIGSANETYRAKLHDTLCLRVDYETLPTLSQLNLFATLYFDRFDALLPILHTSTFRSTPQNPLLFLSICSIGSLLFGPPRANYEGRRIFERLNKVIIVSWESVLSQRLSDALSMIQAAVLCQVYAILARDPKFLVQADAMHEKLSAWSFEANNQYSQAYSEEIFNENDIEGSWHRWVDGEQRARIQTALSILDSELASLLHHQPSRRNRRIHQRPPLAPDSLFAASTAVEWAELFRIFLQSQTKYKTSFSSHLCDLSGLFPRNREASSFTSYSMLEGINARLVHAKRSGEFDLQTCQSTSNHLIQWWQTHHTSDHDPFCLPILWHSTFIALYADLDLLEIFIGRDGSAAAIEALIPAREWGSSLNAIKCLLHAFLISRHYERMRLSDEPAIHVPRALLSAALIYVCHVRYFPQRSINGEAFASPEIQLLGNEGLHAACFFQARRENDGHLEFADWGHLNRLVGFLSQGRRWGISQAMVDRLFILLGEGYRSFSS